MSIILFVSNVLSVEQEVRIRDLESQVVTGKEEVVEEDSSKKILVRRVQELTLEVFALRRELFRAKDNRRVHFQDEDSGGKSLSGKRTRSGASFGTKRQSIVEEDLGEKEENASLTLAELLAKPANKAHRVTPNRVQYPVARFGDILPNDVLDDIEK